MRATGTDSGRTGVRQAGPGRQADHCAAAGPHGVRASQAVPRPEAAPPATRAAVRPGRRRGCGRLAEGGRRPRRRPDNVPLALRRRGLQPGGPPPRGLRFPPPSSRGGATPSSRRSRATALKKLLQTCPRGMPRTAASPPHSAPRRCAAARPPSGGAGGSKERGSLRPS